MRDDACYRFVNNHRVKHKWVTVEAALQNTDHMSSKNVSKMQRTNIKHAHNNIKNELGKFDKKKEDNVSPSKFL